MSTSKLSSREAGECPQSTPWPAGDGIVPFSVGYTKGWRRCVTALIVCAGIRKLNIRLADLTQEFQVRTTPKSGQARKSVFGSDIITLYIQRCFHTGACVQTHTRHCNFWVGWCPESSIRSVHGVVGNFASVKEQVHCNRSVSMASSATRKAPNAFMFCRQIDVLKRASSEADSATVLWLRLGFEVSVSDQFCCKCQQ